MKRNTLSSAALLLALILALSVLFGACVPGDITEATSGTDIKTTSPSAESTPSQTTSPAAESTPSQTTSSAPVTPVTGNASIEFYAINDLHGNISGNDRNVGIDKTSSYLRNRLSENKNTVLLSTGDMWQGSSESNNTKGALVTEWMNSLGFVSMTLGNHEFDWTSKAIAENSKIADFPFLALNVYETATNKLAPYCEPSVMTERDGVKIGIIGAIGDCYGSISSSAVEDVRFITGKALTELVKAESEKLRSMGADIIVYAIHDGLTQSTYTSAGGSAVPVSDSRLGSDFYDISLSNGYVDLVFEGHQHTTNVYTDSRGVYHLQAGGYNQALMHVSVDFDRTSKKMSVRKAELVFSSSFSSLPSDGTVSALLDKYASQIGDVNSVLGYNDSYMNSNELRQLGSYLYLKAGLEKWGADFDIFLGGGYLSCRSPGYLEAGGVCYKDLQALFPFDNNLVLCSVSGASMLNSFINTSNSNYFITYSDTGKAQKNNVSLTKTYYIITDTYSSDYKPNNLTVIDVYSESGFYMRDLYAEYIKAGKLGSEPESLSVPDLFAAEDGTLCEITGKVAAENAQSFLLDDGHGLILVYFGTAYDGKAEVGDTVNVSGKVSTYSKVKQIASPVYKIVSSGTYAYPSPKVLTGREADAYVSLSSPVPEYIKITGVVNISGRYVNLRFAGASCVGSVVYPSDDLSRFNGKTVSVEGYFLYISGSSTRYFNIIVTDIAEVKSASLTVAFISPAMITV